VVVEMVVVVVVTVVMGNSGGGVCTMSCCETRAGQGNKRASSMMIDSALWHLPVQLAALFASRVACIRSPA